MAHELKGKNLKAGDKVNVPCIVEATAPCCAGRGGG